MPSLIVRIGGTAPWEVPLDRSECTVGRSEDCDLPLEDDGVSRQHATFHVAGSKVTVEDLDSRNGTFVEGERVERRALKPGDRVRLGPNVELELVGDVEKARRARSSRAARSRHAAPAPSGGFLMRTEWTLIPEEPGGRSHPIPLRARVITVGRKGSANLALEDESVSRLHARFDREHDALFVTDLKSRNGTFVNDEPAMRAPLEDGDIVTFGSLPFAVRRRSSFAWQWIAAGFGALALLVVLGFVAVRINDALVERRTVAEAKPRLKRQAVQNIERGIAACRQGDADYARGYLLNAADMLLYLDLAPPGTSLTKPAEVFRAIASELPEGDRDFDFGQVFAEALPVGLENLSNRDYVARRVHTIAIELGLDQEVPPGFIDQVWTFVDRFASNPRGFQSILDRAPRIQPRLRAAMASARLPEVFCYVAWNESALDPQATSRVGAKGLWQFMPAAAHDYGLRVSGEVDERTDVERSTQAATKYIGNLIKMFGREQFMCALASYNQGPGAVRTAMTKINDPMMEASKKYWYLAENGLIPKETGEYVAKIFANMILAENPERFGFRRPGTWR
jgi:pSer/pThr/pTyr-binding forkhead associated (FHA) protein